MYLIYPQVRLQKEMPNECTIKDFYLYFDTKIQSVIFELNQFLSYKEASKEKSNILFLNKTTLPEQCYEIDVEESKIKIYAHSPSGFYYATKTLKQMMQSTLKCVHIEDGPDIMIRGFMYDISRNKVPKLETLKYIIDVMSDLKMNHFEVYVEGFSFEYTTFKQYLEKESYITIQEYEELEAYARLHEIDFVPNQNGFGHMSDWLEKEEFKDLAEAPNGIDLWGTHRAPSTLNALDGRSIELVKKMYHDMLPHSHSSYFHMNFDEPFELGKDKTKEACQTQGEAKVYLDYTLKAYEEAKKYHKTPMIWGDVLIRHDDILDQIPKDMIFVDWGYDAEYPFHEHLLKLKKAGVPFMAAPGSSTWCSLLGRTIDWVETIQNAVWNIYELGGLGVLLTDWGDVGHLQHLPATLPPLVYCGLLTYRTKEGTYKQLKDYLNHYIFHDEKCLIADILMDLGTYYKYEPHYTGNGSVTFYSMVWALNAMKEEDPIQYFTSKMKYNYLSLEEYYLLNDFFDQKKKELSLSKVDSLIKDEINHSISLLQTIMKISFGHQTKQDLNYRILCFEDAIHSIDGLIRELKRLWLVRNKYSGLNKTIANLEKVKIFAIKSLDFYKGGAHETQN